MTKRKQDDQQEARKSLSEWQRRNKEYLEKKAQEEAERQKQLEQEQTFPEPDIMITTKPPIWASGCKTDWKM